MTLGNRANVAELWTGSIIEPVSRRSPHWWQNWQQRHRHPVSRGLHFVGIPLAIAALALAGCQLVYWRWDLWWRPAVLLAVGYLLQYVGHRIEGNDMGEVILVKRLLGQPYQAVAPRDGDENADSGGSACHP